MKRFTLMVSFLTLLCLNIVAQNFELAEARQDGVIKITSAESGKTYYTLSTQGEKTLTADLTGLPSGEYLLHYYDGSALIATQKIHRL